MKDILEFCDRAVFNDDKNIGIIEELHQVRKCVINNFHETIPVNRNLISLSNIDDMILKFNDNDIENMMENLHELREKNLYMIGLQRVVKEDVDKVRDDDLVII